MTIKAFPQMGEGAEHSEADEGECGGLRMAGKHCQPKAFPLEGKVANAMSRMRRGIRRCLWQIQADAAPMRQRVLQALASQNDYAELRGP